MKTVIDIAKICHQSNKAVCETIGDFSQVDWDEAPLWQKETVIDGVEFYLNTSNVKPEDSHNNWIQKKLQDGWTYGPIKDLKKKQHPCLISYDQLPIEQQLKDKLFCSIIDVFKKN